MIVLPHGRLIEHKEKNRCPPNSHPPESETLPQPRSFERFDRDAMILQLELRDRTYSTRLSERAPSISNEIGT